MKYNNIVGKCCLDHIFGIICILAFMKVNFGLCLDITKQRAVTMIYPPYSTAV